MDTTRKVTEQDFRMPEFRDAKPEDYEFRNDGKVVRKDRWEKAVVKIRFLVGVDGRSYEIEEVIAAVEGMAEDQQGWIEVEESMDPDDMPEDFQPVEFKHRNGSILKDACYTAEDRWKWFDQKFETKDVTAWRPIRKKSEDPK